MKQIIKISILSILGIIIIPIFSIFFFSFLHTEGDTFRWYSEILNNSEFVSSLFLSVSSSLITALVSTAFAFTLSLSWFDKQQRFAVTLLIVILGLVPPDILALGISKISQILELYNSNLFFTIIGLSLYCLPFSILLLWSRFYFIDNVIIKSAKDIGMNNFNISYKILLLISLPTVITTIIVNFILALNEYPRTYYLSGYHNFLSEYLFGKLNSGADESIYAGSGLTIFITFILLITVYIVFKSFRKKEYRQS